MNEDRIKAIIEENSRYKDLLYKIYIARNITLSEDGVKQCLTEIDNLFREENYN